MRVGRTAAPPAVTRTLAVTVEPALGFAGVSLTAPTETVAGLPPPGGAVTTTTVPAALLLERSGSETEVCVISARST